MDNKIYYIYFDVQENCVRSSDKYPDNNYLALAYGEFEMGKSLNYWQNGFDLVKDTYKLATLLKDMEKDIEDLQNRIVELEAKQ